MPRNPKATSPNAKTAGATISAPRPVVLTPKAMAISAIIVSPNQNALKFPATKPDRMFNDAPPSRDDATISRTCAEWTDVKTSTSSGMIAPASVPHVITSDSFHHRVGSPPILGISSRDTRNVSATDTNDVSQTSVVSGVSKFMCSAVWYRAFVKAAFRKYERPDATIIMTRIAKIHTSNCTLTSGSWTPSRMNEISATPVTPYVSNPSALGPTESPALAPVQSAMTPGLRASSSLILNTTFMRSEPMSAIFVKIPPAMRSAEAPSDSPMAKPRKQAPAYLPGMNSRIVSMTASSTQMSSTPIDIPDCRGISYTGVGLPRSEAKAVRLLA